MIGLVLGMPPIALFPTLPDAWFMLLLACLAPLGLWRQAWLFRFGSGIALGAALAVGHGQALLEHRLAQDCVGAPLRVSGQVASLPRSSWMYDGVLRQRFEFTLDSIYPVACSGPRRILLSYYGAEQIVPGQHWQFEVKLKRPWGLANPGSFNMQAWFAQSGIDAVGSVKTGGAILTGAPSGYGVLHHRLRFDISQSIATLPFSSEVVAILGAITVADKSGIDTPLWSLLQLYGINHLLVISGLHVGLVAGAGYFLGGFAMRLLLLHGFRAPRLPALLALCFATVYAALAGFSVATLRALCMLACFLLAGLVGRNSGSANNLLLAAAVVLLLNPLAVLGSGLWLSFTAVAALLWLARWQGGLGKGRLLLATHGFMSLLMLPLGAWWFGGASLVAAFANLFMIPLIGMFVVPLALLAVLCSYLAPWLQMVLWHLAAWPLEKLLPLAKWLAQERASWLYWQLTPSLPGVLLAGLGLALIILPLSARLRALAALLFLPLVLPQEIDNRDTGAEAGGSTLVTVLDVGQGTAVVLRSGGRVLVYDTGGGDPAGANMATAVLLPFLRQQGVTRLDTLVVSHADNDHSAGASTLLAALSPEQVFYGGNIPGLASGRPCVAGQSWDWPGGLRFRFLSPALESTTGLPSNDTSCVLQIEASGSRLLLPGDIEAARERELVRYWTHELASDWLLVPHHGSKTSSSHALLKHVRPATAVVSSGYANRFGHPHPSVLVRLGKSGSRIYDTADSGALEFEFLAGQPVQVRRHRDQLRRFWM
jgi:competence protein ComEC